MCEHPTPAHHLGRRGLLLGAGAGTLGLGLAATGLADPLVAGAASGTSQNGWYAADDMVARNMINQEFAAGGVRFPAGVRRKAPTVILGYVARQFHRHVEPLRNPGCWGYNYRPVTGGTELSNHASGTAIDCNAPQHPYGASGTFGRAQVREIRKILTFCEGTVRWGGDYNGTKDEMHFELNVGPNSPKIDRIVNKIKG
ncbi:M15 family peptidase [Desertihabitans brevis]|uniref:M15 family peptidase n=1 Tax=Desertihabitans brevis TaxID=2268447 RepID=A0A367YSF5_9ACTN|nr:M15 family metallopeptidase [Desertihabitans brevis]RCK68815.1 M15 family peptidase [Desertihabitans brevis]